MSQRAMKNNLLVKTNLFYCWFIVWTLFASHICFGGEYQFNERYWLQGPVEGSAIITDILTPEIYIMQVANKEQLDVLKHAKDINKTTFFDDLKLEVIVRLFGVDSDNLGNIVDHDTPVTDYVTNLIKSKEVIYYCFLTDYYGRPVCSIRLTEGTDIAYDMIKNGYSYYDMAYGIHPVKKIHKEYKRVDN